jgi:hypothetical protein
VVPDAPGPGVHYTRAEGLDPESCEEAITDGRGEWIGVGIGYHRFRYGFVSASAPGEPIGRLDPYKDHYGNGGSIAPQPDGYHAVSAYTGPGPFQRYDAKGVLLAESSDRNDSAWAIEGIPGGGSVLIVEGSPRSEGSAYRLVWMGAQGEKRAEAAMPSAPRMAVSSTGSVLAFAAGRARWYDRAGAPITDWFPDGGASVVQLSWHEFTPVALADGSIVIGLGTDAPRRFEAAAAEAAPPPEWITSRASAALHDGHAAIAAVRGNRANAFATLTQGPAGCEVEIELLTPVGESCGTTRLEAPAPCERVSFGADRTVFTTGMRYDPSPGASSCSWHWWTGLLR